MRTNAPPRMLPRHGSVLSRCGGFPKIGVPPFRGSYPNHCSIFGYIRGTPTLGNAHAKSSDELSSGTCCSVFLLPPHTAGIQGAGAPEKPAGEAPGHGRSRGLSFVRKISDSRTEHRLRRPAFPDGVFFFLSKLMQMQMLCTEHQRQAQNSESIKLSTVKCSQAADIRMRPRMAFCAGTDAT